MGLFKRLHRITIGRIQKLLDRAEDPEILLPELVREMEEQLAAAAEAEAKGRAALRRARREHEAQQAKIARLDRGATRAMELAREDTARMAVEAQIDCERFAEVLEQNLDRAQDTLDHAVAARKHIQQQLGQLRARKSEILTRARIARARKKIHRTLHGTVGSADSILDTVARLEDGIEEIEAELEIHSAVIGESDLEPSLERRLRQLDADAEVEQRMARLRERTAPANRPTVPADA